MKQPVILNETKWKLYMQAYKTRHVTYEEYIKDVQTVTEWEEGMLAWNIGTRCLALIVKDVVPNTNKISIGYVNRNRERYQSPTEDQLDDYKAKCAKKEGKLSRRAEMNFLSFYGKDNYNRTCQWHDVVHGTTTTMTYEEYIERAEKESSLPRRTNDEVRPETENLIRCIDALKEIKKELILDNYIIDNAVAIHINKVRKIVNDILDKIDSQKENGVEEESKPGINRMPKLINPNKKLFKDGDIVWNDGEIGIVTKYDPDEYENCAGVEVRSASGELWGWPVPDTFYATQAQVDEFYTVKVDGVRYRLYEKDDIIWIYDSSGNCDSLKHICIGESFAVKVINKYYKHLIFKIKNVEDIIPPTKGETK